MIGALLGTIVLLIFAAGLGLVGTKADTIATPFAVTPWIFVAICAASGVLSFLCGFIACWLW